MTEIKKKLCKSSGAEQIISSGLAKDREMWRLERSRRIFNRIVHGEIILELLVFGRLFPLKKILTKIT